MIETKFLPLEWDFTKAEERPAVIRLDLEVDAGRMLSEMRELCPDEWSPTTPTLQQAIQYDPACVGSVLLDACGSVKDGMDESRFGATVPHLAGSYIEQVLHQLPWNAFRSRFMRLSPKSCYSIHWDISWRVHIPLATNEHCWMAFFDKPEFVHLKPGNVYLVNTMRPHTYLNGGLEDRVHIVASVPLRDSTGAF